MSANMRAVLTDYAKRVGAYLSATPNVGNVGAGEDDLMSTSLPANVFEEAGDVVDILAYGTAANNANAKTLKLYFGSVAIANQALTVSQAGKWVIRATVIRTANDVQEAHAITCESVGTTLAAGKHAQEITALTQDEEAAITVKCTGTGVADNDIVQEGFVVLPRQIVRGGGE